MKYAHIENEQRYLFQGIKLNFIPVRELLISDRYLIESTLRLRRVEEVGKPLIFKLGQKIRVKDDSSLQIAHTTMYISEAEFEVLASLPSNVLVKKRSILPLGELHLAIDEFEGDLKGLTLLEVDVGEEGLPHDRLPFEKVTEVTRDERFTGGKLAGTSTEGLRLLLTEYGVN